MRKFFALIMVTILAMGLMFSDAEAKRFGGGRSFGAARGGFSNYSRSVSPTVPRRSGFNWGGIVTGLIVGGLLSSLFMGHGFGTGIMSWIFVLGFGLLIFNLLRNRSSSFSNNNPYQSNFQTPFAQANQQTMANGIGVRDEDFLRAAKVLFMRMQEAYDAKNLDDIRQFTSPEVTAEVQLQFQERGDAQNHTEVVSLNSEILDANTQQASVRFSGMIKEDMNQPAAAFAEIWHFDKNATTQKWIVSGIQQD